MRLTRRILPAAAGLFVLTACSKSTEESSAPGPVPNAPAAKVGYIEIQPESVDRRDLVPGRVVAYQVAEIRPQVSGIIQSRLFEEGSFVEEGQQLYQIDAARYEAEYERAKGNLEDAEARRLNAEALFQRVAKLFKADSVSQQQYDEAKYGLKQAEAAVGIARAEVKTAKINLDYTRVRAPISGYISPSNVTKGALVTERQSMPLATVRQLDPVYVDLSKSARLSSDLRNRLTAARMKNDGETDFAVTLFPTETGEPYSSKGTLDVADLAVDPQTGSIRLRSVFPNPDKVLLPGMFVRASIADSEDTKAIIVPQKSIIIEPGGGKSVWVIDSEDLARKRPVKTGEAFGNQWIILEGLTSGDRLIVEGAMTLRDGAPVRPNRIEPKN